MAKTTTISIKIPEMKLNKALIDAMEEKDLDDFSRFKALQWGI
jgi:hypothetical protein